MKPELLSPAGSPAALEAAVMAGADAVYFGGQSFNARKNADNFNDEELLSAVRKCRLYGVKTNIVLNTQLYSAELTPALLLAEKLLSYGADAFIVADVGLATELLRHFPGISLHASTQCSGQNALSAKELADIGFERMVAPRELPFRDIKTLCETSPIETEIFVHGALCVSHSGQCLMSSIIGGRSGNRGECAQPCRLPYQSKNPYPLSLKDLCLAAYIPELVDAGVASFKIEGRMKTPDYVYGVISIYRKLIDEHRGATEEEIRKMASLFCRSGFTDGYHLEKINKNMLGVRTDADKQITASADKTVMNKRKIDLSLSADFLVDKPCTLVGKVERDGSVIEHTVVGDACVKAEKTPTSAERIAENLSKLGATPFMAAYVDVRADEVNVPISSINAMRRELASALEEKLIGEPKQYPKFDKLVLPRGAVASDEKSAYFAFYDTVTKKAKGFFDRIFVPLTEYVAHIEDASKYKNIGIALPPVMFDHEVSAVCEMAKMAALAGCRMALVPGFGQGALADELGLEKHGDIRLNAYNSTSVSVYAEKGFASLLLSPEIGVSASMGVASSIPKGYVAYGRLPLMTMEKCAIRDMMLPGVMSSSGCRYCDTHKFSYLTDRTGAKFPMTREYQHRNVIYNSVPTYMADKPLEGLFSHAIFTCETAEEVDAVIDSIEKRLPAKTKFRRL